ncbi:MAG TPA: hypothetical protein VFX06_07310 [Stellaceae bacterium]|nr:hypothetical protein [Stellaceae bacterium]
MADPNTAPRDPNAASRASNEEAENPEYVEGGSRLTLRLSPEARKVLEDIAALRGGVSFAEVVRRALGTELFLIKARQEGARILIETPDHTIREIILI